MNLLITAINRTNDFERNRTEIMRFKVESNLKIVNEPETIQIEQDSTLKITYYKDRAKFKLPYKSIDHSN